MNTLTADVFREISELTTRISTDAAIKGAATLVAEELLALRPVLGQG